MSRHSNDWYKKKAFYEKHRPAMLIRQKKYREKNKDRLREWQKKYNARNKDKILDRKRISGAARAHVLVYNAVKDGILINLKEDYIICIDCEKSRATAYDHRDYNKPLQVAPVCLPCNIKRGPAIPLNKGKNEKS